MKINNQRQTKRSLIIFLQITRLAMLATWMLLLLSIAGMHVAAIPVLDLNGPNVIGTTQRAVATPAQTLVPIAMPAVVLSNGADITSLSVVASVACPTGVSGVLGLKALNTGTLNVTTVNASITLTGAGTAADYQAALQSVVVSGTLGTCVPASSPVVDVTVTLWYSNGVANVSAAAFIYPASAATTLQPVIATSTPNITYNAATTDFVMLFNDSLSLTSPNGLLVGAFAVLNGLETASDEGLSVSTIGTNITAVYTASTRTLALNGLAPVSTYLAALNTVSYFDFTLVEALGARAVVVQVRNKLMLKQACEHDCFVVAGGWAGSCGKHAAHCHGYGCCQLAVRQQSMFEWRNVCVQSRPLHDDMHATSGCLPGQC